MRLSLAVLLQEEEIGCVNGFRCTSRPLTLPFQVEGEVAGAALRLQICCRECQLLSQPSLEYFSNTHGTV